MDRQQPNPPVDLIISREPEDDVAQLRATLEATAAQRRAEDDARALLAQAEPEVRGPSDEELLRLAREWNSGYESIEFEFITDFARAVLARYGRPTPAPAGEAGELVAWLTEQAVRAADCKQPMAAGMLTWAAQVVGEHTELLGRCHAAPVPLLPEGAQVIEPTKHTILVPASVPVPVSERPWERDGWCDEQGQCWVGDPGGGGFIPSWRLCRPEDAPNMKVSLPANALPLPAGEVQT